jgi:hypothetical protein
MKTRQRRQHMHQKRVEKRSKKAQERRSAWLKASHTTHHQKTPQIAFMPFLELLTRGTSLHEQLRIKDDKVIPFPVFQSNRRAKAEMESAA